LDRALWVNLNPDETMQLPMKEKQAVNLDKQHSRLIDAAIGQQVIASLGQPDDLHKVLVRRLWENHYRVNVFVGVDEVSNKIAHSYFLVADGDGKIVSSTPKITRKY
jgi:hypothetical protein